MLSLVTRELVHLRRLGPHFVQRVLGLFILVAQEYVGHLFEAFLISPRLLQRLIQHLAHLRLELHPLLLRLSLLALIVLIPYFSVEVSVQNIALRLNPLRLFLLLKPLQFLTFVQSKLHFLLKTVVDKVFFLVVFVFFVRRFKRGQIICLCVGRLRFIVSLGRAFSLVIRPLFFGVGIHHVFGQDVQVVNLLDF